MKNNQLISGILTLALVLSMGLTALAEDNAAAETAPAAVTETTASTTDAAALQDAMTAYYNAKQSARTTELETEITAMVTAGQLTQEQADLILSYAKERTALQNGVCPSCGYQFQTSVGNGRHKGSSHNSMGLSLGNGRSR